MDFKLTDEQQAFKKELEVFFEAEMKKAPPEFGSSGEALYGSDECWNFHLAMKKKLAEKGWLTMAWPKEFGGRDAPIIDQLIFSEVHAYHRAPGIDGFGVKMFAPTLMLFANDEQKERILPPIANGEANYCQGWSEPNAGSDLAALKTTAEFRGDHYVVNGQKIWTTGAHRADHMFMLARTDPSQKRSRGLSVFNIEDMHAPGIEVRPIQYMNGGHFYNEVYFTDLIVPDRDRIGEENAGWQSTRATMNFERSGVGNFIAARRRLEELVEYCKTTKRDGVFLTENPLIRQKLAKLHIDAELGRALAYKVAWEQDSGNPAVSATMASESKVFGSELSQRIANFSTEFMGLHGQLVGGPWAPLGGTMAESYQGCMGGNIAAGSSEIQRNIIAWAGLGLPRFN